MKLSTESTVINDAKLNTNIDNAQETADNAQSTANTAVNKADTAQGTATNAKSVADNTAQYFWFKSSGTDTGAHITEQTQSQFVANPSGGNLLARTNGIAVRDGLTELATFGSSMQIGESAKSHVYVDYHSMQLIDKEGSSYLHISDLRDASGKAEITDQWTGTGGQSSSILRLTFTATSTDYTVKVNGSVVTSGITKTTTSITFATPPASGATITATYYTTDANTKAYTLGTRDSSGTVGAFSFTLGESLKARGQNAFAEGKSCSAGGKCSHAEGYSATANGNASHAEGYGTTASENYSHAEGLDTTASGYCSHAGGQGTIAQGDNQTAIGVYNEAKNDSLFIVGNGSSDVDRVNAFEVNPTGIRVAGHSSDVGTIVDAYLQSSMVVPTNTYKALCSITLDAGVWVLTAQTSAGRSNVGYRTMGIGSFDGDAIVDVTSVGVDGNFTDLTKTYILNPTSTTTYYLNVRQTSGGDLTYLVGYAGSRNSMRAVRIA